MAHSVKRHLDVDADAYDDAIRRFIPHYDDMLETGVGRALNLALAAMPGFTLPGDTSASARYFEHDLTQPFELGSDGTMAVPSEPGIGVTPLPERLRACVAGRELIVPRKSDKIGGPG